MKANNLVVLTNTAKQILGVSTLDKDEIYSAYRKKAKDFHPDKTGKERTMKLINQAYEILVNPDINNQYDLLEEFCGLVSEKETEKKKKEKIMRNGIKDNFMEMELFKKIINIVNV